jgi:hypothetical protein
MVFAFMSDCFENTTKVRTSQNTGFAEQVKEFANLANLKRTQSE